MKHNTIETPFKTLKGYDFISLSFLIIIVNLEITLEY